MKSLTITHVCLLLLCIVAACKKDSAPNEEDYIVKNGSQEFGVYVKGSPWRADHADPGSGISPIDVRMFWDPVGHYNYVVIRGLKSNEEVSLFIPPPLVPGRKLLNTTTLPHPQSLTPCTYGMYTAGTPARKYMTNEAATGYVDISVCDTVTRKIAGTFQFDAINTDTHEKIAITRGQFKN